MKVLFAVVMLDAYYLMMKSIVQRQSLLSELLVPKSYIRAELIVSIYYLILKINLA